MNVSERAKEKLDVASKEIRDAVENLKQEVAALSNKVKEKLKGSGDEFRESADELARETKRLSERVKDLIPSKRRHSLPVHVERRRGVTGDNLYWPFMDTWRSADRIFDDFFRSTGRLPGEWGASPEWMPDRLTGEGFRADLSETDDEVRLSAELPGVESDELSVSVSSGLVTIRGEKRAEQEHKESNYYSLERSYGAFNRNFRLPAEVTPEKAEASFKDGVLTVRMPKSETARRRSRKINIRSG
ncbi:MAG: Hsp20 family protein [Thermodesulfobacteriota bacterium]